MTNSWKFLCGLRFLTGYTFYLIFWGPSRTWTSKKKKNLKKKQQGSLRIHELGFRWRSRTALNGMKQTRRRHRGSGIKTLGGSAVPCKEATTGEGGKESLTFSGSGERTMSIGEGRLSKFSGQLHWLLLHPNKMNQQINNNTCELRWHLVPNTDLRS